MLIRDVRPWGGPASDVVIEEGRIAAIRPHDESVPLGAGDVEGRGRLLLPSFSDVHVHLDSSRIGLPFREHTGSPGVWGMMMNDRRNWRSTDVPHADIVAGTLERMIARGTTRVRSYAQVDVDCKLEKFDSVMAAKEKFAGQAEVQIMTFPQAGILLEEGTVDYLEESLKQGADVMGGIDPSQLDRDPVKHLDIVFGLAEKYQVEIDIHLHEPGHLGVFSTELVLERVRALGMQGKVTMSHAYELGGVNEATSRRLIDEFAELDIAMASVARPPATSSRSSTSSPPACASASARTASATTGAPTATATCWIAPGSWRSRTTSAGTSTSRCAWPSRPWVAPASCRTRPRAWPACRIVPAPRLATGPICCSWTARPRPAP